MNEDIDVIQGANHFGLYVIQESNSFGTVEIPIRVVASSTLAIKIKNHLEDEPKHRFREDSFNIFKVPFAKK